MNNEWHYCKDVFPMRFKVVSVSYIKNGVPEYIKYAQFIESENIWYNTLDDMIIKDVYAWRNIDNNSIDNNPIEYK